MSWFKIFSAVLVANIVSWIIVTILGWFMFFVVLDSFNDALDEVLSSQSKIEFPTVSFPSYSPPKPPAPTPQEIKAKQEREKRLAAERRRVKREAEQKRSAIASSKEMCDFWTSEYRKDGNPKSQAYKEMACSRYRNLLN